MLKREQVSKHNFQLQLLSDRKLVLAELENYESEIFLPQIQTERITLLNVIPGRDKSDKITGNRETIHKGKCQQHILHKMQHATKSLPASKKFVIKLISKNNVVLVECTGYESEIFLPHIQSRGIIMKRVSAKHIVECSRWHSNVGNKLSVNPTILLEGLRGAMIEVETNEDLSSDKKSRQNDGDEMQLEKPQKIKPYQYRFHFGMRSLKQTPNEKVEKEQPKRYAKTSLNDKLKKKVSSVLVKRKFLKRLPNRDKGDYQFSSHFKNAIGALNGSKKLPKILAACAVPGSIDL